MIWWIWSNAQRAWGWVIQGERLPRWQRHGPWSKLLWWHNVYILGYRMRCYGLPDMKRFFVGNNYPSWLVFLLESSRYTALNVKLRSYYHTSYFWGRQTCKQYWSLWKKKIYTVAQWHWLTYLSTIPHGVQGIFSFSSGSISTTCLTMFKYRIL